MMDYEVFKNVVTARIKEFLPPIFARFNVDVNKTNKINGIREAMVLSLESEECYVFGPNVYLDEQYEKFSECGDMDEILQNIAETIIEFTGTQPLGETGMIDLTEYKNNIVQMLINTDMNRDLLESVPHKEYFDLSLIYRIAVPYADGTGYATALITNELMEELEMTADELDKLAEENSRRDLPTQLFRMGPYLTMMTTESKMYGAINLLRTDEIKKLSDEMDGSLYLLPSSVHDLMVLKDDGHHVENGLFEMLKSGNDKCNDIDENLSYNIYYYDREENKLELKCRSDAADS